ncbi:efflux RND transporter permease subunit [Gammaproteobacteria bacterium LSUCC0057]|uniref:Efflux RND transporter permease subunit n=1 Tax=Gammaproteobacteria bacterium LSUCC0057 TaxID=2559237 RepID=A0A4Y8UF37_9GAMM|nr:efflux RND transporter permease subunit [Gammaproteobacteria bacterium LSUCC0057]
MKLLSRAFNQYRVILALLVMILLAGMISRSAMTVEVSPNVQVPVVLVLIRHDGISPEDGARLLIRPVEKELKTLDGIEEITATAREGSVYIAVEFDIDRELGDALADTREAVSRARAEFPSDTKEPIVKEIAAIPEPTIVVNFSGDAVSERDLYRAALFFQRELESLPNVLEARMLGQRQDVVEILLDRNRLQSFGISADQVIASVQRNNLLIPAGELDTAAGRFSIKLPALLEVEEDIRALPIAAAPGVAVTLGDIAQVKRSFEDASGFSYLNGVKNIALNVFKRTQSNAITTVAEVKQVVADYRASEAPNIEIDYFFDMSENASNQVNELSGNILTAMALVLTLVVATLGVRSGLLVGFGIPFSLLGAIIIINLLGYSFNFMVMFGLLLALGMLIDGAIVIVEFAAAEMDKGADAKSAYGLAVSRMAVPVLASTGTTLAAFLPLLFWPGVSGRFMVYLPVTVFAVLAWSLLYALLFAPTLGVVSAKLSRGKPPGNILAPLTRLYRRALTVVMRHTPLVGIGSIVLMWAIFSAYGRFGAGVEFFTDAESQYGVVSVRALGNLPVEERARLALMTEQLVRQVPGVTQVYASSGGSSIGTDRQKSADEIGEMLVELAPRRERSKDSHQTFAEIRQRTADLPGIIVTGKPLEVGPPVGKDLQIQLTATDREALHRSAGLVREWVSANIAGLRDIEDTRPLAGIEWEIAVDRARAAMLGVDINAVGQMVQMVTNGVRIGAYRPDDADDEVELRMRFERGDRSLQALDDLRVNTANGAVPISSFTQRVAKPRVDTIQRVDLRETIFVLANTEEGYVTDNQVRQIDAWLQTGPLQPGVSYTFRGANEEQADAGAFLGVAFSMAMFLMLILLVAQFNSFYQAALILFSVVMSTAGVMLGLIINQQLFSVILTGTGLVALAGIVVNNNIVLIDGYNYLRKNAAALSITEAAIEAAVGRFRPVMLTTVTTIVGLLPLANGLSVDIINRTWEHGGEIASWWKPLAGAIVNGLAFATVMTLFLTPVLLVLPERLRTSLQALRRRWRTARSES